jgi:hypothetical protein
LQWIENINWIYLLTFIAGAVFGSFFSEVGKELFKYIFRRNLIRHEKEKQKIFEYMKQGLFKTTKEIQLELLPSRDIEYVYDLLEDMANEKHDRFKEVAVDGSTTETTAWRFLK